MPHSIWDYTALVWKGTKARIARRPEGLISTQDLVFLCNVIKFKERFCSVQKEKKITFCWMESSEKDNIGNGAEQRNIRVMESFAKRAADELTF